VEKVRLRFAPSPTGPLHIGGARSALFNYLYAKKHGGDFILRIEDTDLDRSNKESEENIKASLKWLGIEWNEGIDVGGEYGPYRQTERLTLYNEYIDKLLAEGKAYRCYCSEEEIATERQEQLNRNEVPKYSGKCSQLTKEQETRYIDEGRKPVIRFKVPKNHDIVIDDLVRGQVVFESNGIGDFVIIKSDGIPVYNFAVVIDDVTMDITHVVRGEEHLSNTPRQILLYEALNLKTPKFAHISLILGKDRSKMSKRHGSTSVVNYMEAGYLPEGIINFLALLGWSPEGEEEFFNMEELISAFSLERVAKNPAVFDMDKLKYINANYIRGLSEERLAQLSLPYLIRAGYITDNNQDLVWIRKICKAVQTKIECLSEIVDHARIFFPGEGKVEDEEAKAIIQEEQVPEVMGLLIRKLEALPEITPQTVQGELKAITKELKLGGKKVYMPARIVLSGQMHGPDLPDIIAYLGMTEIKARIKQNLGLEL
jgi:nondiscriminating glutamyl-tRNA synthetase